MAIARRRHLSSVRPNCWTTYPLPPISSQQSAPQHPVLSPLELYPRRLPYIRYFHAQWQFFQTIYPTTWTLATLLFRTQHQVGTCPPTWHVSHSLQRSESLLMLITQHYRLLQRNLNWIFRSAERRHLVKVGHQTCLGS